MSVLFTSACADIYSGGATYWHIYPDLLLVTDYTMVDVLFVHIWILYYTHNNPSAGST